MTSLIGVMSHIATPPPLTPATATLLRNAATNGDLAIYGNSASATSRRARDMASQGLVVYLDAKSSGWSTGMWGAVITCLGFNALWRHHGDTHVDGCGGTWLPDGTCTGCRNPRRLDLLAHEHRLNALPDEERDHNIQRMRLWCTWHGYLRPEQTTTAKVCLLDDGGVLHDGGCMRI